MRILLQARLRRAQMVGLDRVELSTPRLSSACSNQLSYRPSRVRHRYCIAVLHRGIPPINCPTE